MSLSFWIPVVIPNFPACSPFVIRSNVIPLKLFVIVLRPISNFGKLVSCWDSSKISQFLKLPPAREIGMSRHILVCILEFPKPPMFIISLFTKASGSLTKLLKCGSVSGLHPGSGFPMVKSDPVSRNATVSFRTDLLCLVIPIDAIRFGFVFQSSPC